MSDLRTPRLQSQRATRVHAPSQLLLRAPTLLSPQPLAQPPRLGKTKPGGGGGPGLQERSPPRWPPLLPQENNTFNYLTGLGKEVKEKKKSVFQRRWKQKEQKYQLTFGYEMTLR